LDFINKWGSAAKSVTAIIALIGSISALSYPLRKSAGFLRSLWTNKGDELFALSTKFDRDSFKEDQGFMGRVKTEIDYLFDFIKTNPLPGKHDGQYARLCIFVDDLDRCDSKQIVDMLQATILLLVGGPISIWMAIDSRIIVSSIEEIKSGVYKNDKITSISGQEYLDKIVQLAFSLPELSIEKKDMFFKKMAYKKCLKPCKVLIQWNATMESDYFIGVVEQNNYKSLEELLKIVGLKKYEHVFKEVAAAVGIHNLPALLDEIGKIDKNEIDRSDSVENLCFIIFCSLKRKSAANVEFNTPSTSGDPTSSSVGDDARVTDAVDDKSSANEDLTSSFNRNSDLGTVTDTESSTNGGPADQDVNDILLNSSNPDDEPSSPVEEMLTQAELNCLDQFLPFINGNPRKMKKVINQYNLARTVVEDEIHDVTKRKDFLPKLLKFVILVEMWPFRMACILHALKARELFNLKGEGKIDVRSSYCHIGEVTRDLLHGTYDDVIELYRSVVNPILYSHHHASSYLACDSGSYEFEDLLDFSENSKILVKDLKLLTKDPEENTILLRRHAYNLPGIFTHAAQRLFDESTLFKEAILPGSHDDKHDTNSTFSKNSTVLYKHKRDIFHKHGLYHCP